MTKVSRIVYAAFRTQDLESQIDHYTKVMGLNLVAKDSDAAYLSTSGDHHTVVLRKGTETRCEALGFQLPRGTDLAEYAKEIEGHGITTERQSDAQPGIGETLVFTDTKGTRIEAFVDTKPVGVGFQPAGIAPNKLGHVAFSVPDLTAAVDFYCNVLGFKVTERIGDFFAFLRCGSDHHTINLVSGSRVKMHHIAFELHDWNHIRTSSDWLAKDRIPILWGPVRHGVGNNIATYHHDRDGHIVELYCEMDRVNDEIGGVYEPRRVHLQFPQTGKTWTDIAGAANLWGPQAPAEFLD